MIFEMDENFKFVYLSGRVKEVTGRDPEEILGMRISDFLDETENVRLQKLIQNCIDKQTILDTVITVKNVGEIKHRHIIAKPMYGPDSEFIGARGTYRDITPRKNLEKNLAEQNWLLQVALDSVRHCAIVISDAHNKVLK